MGRFIMKLHDEKFQKDYYLEWSTVVDAPVTWGMPLEEFKVYYKEEYGNHGCRDLEDRLKRVEEFGISAYYPYDNLESYFGYNRAGKNGKTIGKELILERFCRNHIEA